MAREPVGREAAERVRAADAPDALLRRLEWRVLRPLDGRLKGAHRTVARGEGLDLAGIRPYTPEDDVRHIDWNATARMDEPFVRLFHEDRDLTAWLVLDVSASMRLGSGDRTKDAALSDVSLSLARMLTLTGDRVGALVYDEGEQRIVPPGSGRDQALRIARELQGVAGSAPAARATDIGAMLRIAANLLRRRSLVIVLSDLIAEPGWERELTRLSHRHEVTVIRLVAPVESELPAVGTVVVEDAETGEQLLVDAGDPLFRERMRRAAAERDAELAAGIRRARAAEHVVSTSDDLARALIALSRASVRRTA